MNFEFQTILVSAAVLLGTILFIEIGRRLGIRSLKTDADGEGSGAVEAALFALLGLLIAFTFSGAASRFDHRRELVTQETNSIGTAYLRVDLLPGDKQQAIRDKFKQYLDSRIATYRDLSTADAETARTEALQKEIWEMSVAASKESSWVPAATLLLPALNDMIDITTTRSMAMQMHPPVIVFVMLIALIYASALLAGFGTAKAKTRSWLHISVFAVILALTVFVIVDLEYPRLGLIRVDAFDEALVNLRSSMK